MTPALFARLLALGFVPGERNPDEWAVSELERVTDEARRLRDLVRHQRGALHDAKLITDEEYAALAADHAAVARLEGYDAVRRLRDVVRRLLADGVSAAEARILATAALGPNARAGAALARLDRLAIAWKDARNLLADTGPR